MIRVFIEFLPVDDVEESVHAKHSYVLTRQVFDDANFLEHYDLWDKR